MEQMQVVWEANTADFAKRKRAARACENCQKRKKRCSHTFSRDSRGNDHEVDQAVSKLVQRDYIRFIGDLNPESILTDLSSRAKGAPRPNRLGTWVQAVPELDHHDGAPTTPAAKIIPAAERYRQVERGRRTLTGHQKNYLQAVGAFRVLPKLTQDVLIGCYIAHIDPLLPVLDGGRLLAAYNAGNLSTWLLQAVCLVACKSEEAADFLRLTEDGVLMDPINFARTLHTGLDAAMKADLEADRLTKVQILTLMSLHNDGPGGIEESSMHLLQAIHESHTAGLHILTHGRNPDDEKSYTWWSIWVLDKINACLGGRAIMVSDHDMGLPRPKPIDADLHSRSSALCMWLALADQLVKVIEYYRPNADQDSPGWEDGFPSFHEIPMNANVAFQHNIPVKAHRDLLEIFYNVIAILTCRSGGSTSKTYRRRVVAANRIQEIITSSRPARTETDGETDKETKDADDLPPLPLLPYAASLALTVAYRQLRDRSTSTNLEQVKRNLEIRCSLLESLSKRWWSADAMAKLGRKALRTSKAANRNGVARTASANAAADAEAAEVGDILDSEVSICKYGPFAQGGQSNNTAVKQNSKSPGNENKKRKLQSPEFQEGTGNALDLLSSAAATYDTRQNPSQSNHAASMPVTASFHQQYQQPTTTTQLPHQPILPTTYTLIDPSLTASTLPPDLTTFPTTTTAAAGYYNPYALRTLDNMFEDFLDVGMPTSFDEVLFSGAMGGSGEGGPNDDAFWEAYAFETAVAGGAGVDGLSMGMGGGGVGGVMNGGGGIADGTGLAGHQIG